MNGVDEAVWAAGRSLVQIFEPNMRFRLVYDSGGAFYADFIYFLSRADTESYSWGAIKELFE